MTVADDCLEVFSFSVMKFPFGFANVEIMTVTTTSFIYNFGHLRTVEPVFVGEQKLGAMCVLENNPTVIAPITYIYTSLELFGINFALQPLIRYSTNRISFFGYLAGTMAVG